MGAFKIRGAYNMIAQLPKEQLERGVIPICPAITAKPALARRNSARPR